MTDSPKVGPPGRSAVDRDRFYVQKDKHATFQQLSRADGAPFGTLKDVWVLSAAMGFAAGRRQSMRGGTQHVGFWRTLTSQEDVPLIQAIAIADAGDIGVLGDQGRVIRIAEEYANVGIDLILESERVDKDSTLRALAAAVVEGSQRKKTPRNVDGADASERLESQVLIASGESARVEFKESARWNEVKGGRDKNLELAVLKTIAGFMNAKGGALFVGVDDGGVPVGLAKDYKTFQGRVSGRDALENWLTTLVEQHLGTSAATDVDISFETWEGTLEFCRIDVAQNKAGPVYADVEGESIFFVRTNNSTRKMDTKQATAYIAKRWG